VNTVPITRRLINIVEKLHPDLSRSECASLTGKYLAWAFLTGFYAGVAALGAGFIYFYGHIIASMSP
jgi:hypothetical protein